MIFDGKRLAREIEALLRQRLRTGEKRIPKIVSILVGEDPASVLYTKLKKAAAERVGVRFEIRRIKDRESQESVMRQVKAVGEDESVDGVMVQLPLPASLRGETAKLLAEIPIAKDVDGLRWEDSGMMPATVRAILTILKKITIADIWDKQFVVVGARGMVGRPLVHYLRERGFRVSEVEWDTPKAEELIKAGEVVISCTGRVGIVTGEMVKEGVVAIDVGSPKGDMTVEVYQKASVAVPSPGGVGPVTIACLMENVVSML
ncbi:MAG: Bifunctional protein FolD [Microgenomates group bacterium GW2011_GWC2_46_7]|nr:MAG: Bifunctional protein FolD [Microgenomates group bacterium GW2011_GWC2_46_7]